MVGHQTVLEDDLAGLVLGDHPRVGAPHLIVLEDEMVRTNPAVGGVSFDILRGRPRIRAVQNAAPARPIPERPVGDPIEGHRTARGREGHGKDFVRKVVPFATTTGEHLALNPIVARHGAAGGQGVRGPLGVRAPRNVSATAAGLGRSRGVRTRTITGAPGIQYAELPSR